MKKIFLFLLSLVITISFYGSPVLAYSGDDIPDQILYWGKKTSATNYPVGACKQNNGGLWQQLADGTWAPPGDPLNTCLTGGVVSGYTGSSLYDPWSRTGINQDTGVLSAIQPVSSYPWGTNYPGGYDNYNSWFYHCVVVESFAPRPECQAFPRSSYFWNVDQPWGSYEQQEGMSASYYTSSSGETATHVSATGGLGNFVMGALVGYGLNQLLK